MSPQPPLYENHPSALFNRKVFAAAADRNKGPILDVLKGYMSALAQEKNGEPVECLEISSGSGQHVSYFAKHFLDISRWQPSEFDTTMFGSILDYSQELGLSNVAAPLCIDASAKPESWPVTGRTFDLIYNANLIHISPPECTPGLFNGSGRLLRPGGILFTYGPYAHGGIITPESNQRFDAMLKTRDPSWGLRDIDDLKTIAASCGLVLEKIHDMPANNKSLIWRKQQ